VEGGVQPTPRLRRKFVPLYQRDGAGMHFIPLVRFFTLDGVDQATPLILLDFNYLVDYPLTSAVVGLLVVKARF